MINAQSENETTFSSTKTAYDFSNEISKAKLATNFVSIEKGQIELISSQILTNPFESIKDLRDISDRQYITLPDDALPDIMTVLSDSFSANPDDSEINFLRKNIFQLLKNIADNPNKEDTNFCELLSDPTCLSIIWKCFPTDNYSAQLLIKIVDKVSAAAAYIIEHEVSTDQLNSMLSLDNPIDIIENVLLFFSSAFSSIDYYIPEIMDIFVDFVCDVISNCLTNIDNSDDENDYEELLDESKVALKKMTKRFEEAATKIVPFLPAICIFNEDSSVSNMNTNSLLKACVKKMNTYEILFTENPEKVIFFISCCFDKANDYNDISVFSVMKLLAALEDVSPIDAIPEVANLIFEKLADIINKNDKYIIKENAVLVSCRLIKHANEQQIMQFLDIIDFSLVLDFTEEENQTIQISILDAIIKIDHFQKNHEFILNLFDDVTKIEIITKLTKSETEEVAERANFITEILDF